MADRRVCVRCILPEAFPGITFNADGVCSVCQTAIALPDIETHCAGLRRGMETAIEAARRDGPYDCIVAYSGGKDSSYTLKLLVERYALRCLAVTVDNGFMSDQARVNCSTITGALGVDWTLFRPAPAFMMGLYARSARERNLHAPAAIKRASNMCSSCISLINSQMIKIAVQNAASLIAGGYIGGQVPRDAAVMRVDVGATPNRVTTEQKLTTFFGRGAERFFKVTDTPGSAGAHVTIINPMLTVRVTEHQLVTELEELGWRTTRDTGQNSTNCRLNDLGIFVHHRQYGFNPYLMEIAEQVRNGLLDRETALRRANAIPAADMVREQAQRIGLDLGDIG